VEEELAEQKRRQVVDRPGQFDAVLRQLPCSVHRALLTVMSGIAELERDLIRKRCQAGIERAKAKGTKFGRPLALDASQRRKIAERYSAGETMAELARDYDCGEATIWRALRGLVAGGPFEHGAVVVPQ
jgi:DNA invertase Pin-like site-specific DNA recombinase